jgi:hypothetical protein
MATLFCMAKRTAVGEIGKRVKFLSITHNSDLTLGGQ